MARLKKLLGLDVGSREAKLVEVSLEGNTFVITNYAQKPVPSEGANAEFLAGLLRDCGAKTKRCVTSVSGRSVIVRYVSMPPQPDTELRKSVIDEADKYIPFDINEVVMDCQKVEENSTESNEVKVLLVAVKRSFIEQHVGMLKNSGLSSHIIDVDAFALGNSFELMGRYGAAVAAPGQVTALIDIGHTKSNVNILQGGTSYFTREIYVGGKDITDSISQHLNIGEAEAEALKISPAERLEEIRNYAQPIFEDLGNEVRLCFEYFENQFDKSVDAVYLSGGSSLFAGVADMFAILLDKPVNLWSPIESLAVDSASVDVEQLKVKAPQLTIAIGLASRILD